jgi:ATP-dependent exoDNAse (exonuclease V) beta subunit
VAAAALAHERAQAPSWSAVSVTAEVKRLPRVALEPTDAPADADPTRAIVPDTPSHRADAGRAWGTLVHGLLEHAMRHRTATRDDLRRLALWLTIDEPRLRAVIERALDTVEVVARETFWETAKASPECHEEVPFAVRDSGGLVPRVLSGTIDLVHRSGERWQVIDYKTDVDTGQAAAVYARQIDLYVQAWRRIAQRDAVGAIVPARDRP